MLQLAPALLLHRGFGAGEWMGWRQQLAGLCWNRCEWQAELRFYLQVTKVVELGFAVAEFGDQCRVLYWRQWVERCVEYGGVEGGVAQ